MNITKGMKYFILSIIVTFIVVGFIFSDLKSDSSPFSEYCKDNGYDDLNIFTDSTKNNIDFNNKIYINCIKTEVINGKLLITNSWLEIDFERFDNTYHYWALLISMLSLLIFEGYSLTKDEWN